MWTRPALLLLGALLLAPATPSAHAQDDARPRRTMRPFGSDAELLQYLAAVDRARPSRRPQERDVCTDSVGRAPGDKRVVITGLVQSQAGSGIASARVSALGRCTTAGADGGYRLELPASVLTGRSRVRVSADFIGYRPTSRTVAVGRRMAGADLTLVPSPVELQELAMVPAAAAAKDESITNTQHTGVDEGGIVKLHGDHLIVLRAGQLGDGTRTQRNVPVPVQGGYTFLERPGLDVGHDIPEPAFVLAGVVDREDVGVVEPGGELDLAKKALRGGGGGELRILELERDRAGVTEVPDAVAGGEGGPEEVRSEGRASAGGC